MKLLKDDELVNCLTSNAPFVQNLAQPTDWFASDSPVQSASVSIHVGEILVPETPDGADGCVGNAKSRHALKPGEVAVIVSRERLKMPGNLAAFGFPPPKVSSFGCFMTNPGHIDAGYEGPLRFTLVNLGRTDFLLVAGDVIFVMLVVELSGHAQRSWIDRRGVAGTPPGKAELARLSADFLEVDTRAKETAKEVAEELIHKAEFELKHADAGARNRGIVYGAMATFLVGLIIGLVQWFAPVATKSSVTEMEKRVHLLDKEVDRLKGVILQHDTERIVKELKDRVEQLESSNPATP